MRAIRIMGSTSPLERPKRGFLGGSMLEQELWGPEFGEFFLVVFCRTILPCLHLPSVFVFCCRFLPLGNQAFFRLEMDQKMFQTEQVGCFMSHYTIWHHMVKPGAQLSRRQLMTGLSLHTLYIYISMCVPWLESICLHLLQSNRARALVYSCPRANVLSACLLVFRSLASPFVTVALVGTIVVTLRTDLRLSQNDTT